LVVGDRLFLYVGHDEAQRDEMFNMREWLVYSTTRHEDLDVLSADHEGTDFKWAKKDAWASQAIEKNGKFYFYAAVEHDGDHPGKAIGVAVSDRPTGPFVDARGSALITNQMTPKGTHSWEDIDPTVFTDGDDGRPGSPGAIASAYIARLKPNMIEIDGPIIGDHPSAFRGRSLAAQAVVTLYYLTYASLDRSTQRDEHVSYATATSITGPWTYRGELTGAGKYSFTIHPGVVEFKGDLVHLLAQRGPGGRGSERSDRATRGDGRTPSLTTPMEPFKPVVQTEAGIVRAGSHDGAWFQAGAAPAAYAKLGHSAPWETRWETMKKLLTAG
jgi:arabinoxylan arabinofuranohydrolase